MKRTTFAILLAVLFCQVQAQDRKALYESFRDATSTGDTLKVQEIIHQWETEIPNDPELYSCYANLYLMQAMQEIVIISDEAPNKECLTFTDSLDVAHYMYSTIYLDSVYFAKTIHTLEEAVRKYPDRIDFWLGLQTTYLYGAEYSDSALYQKVVDVMDKAVERSKQNKNRWLSTLDEAGYGKDDFCSSLQGVFANLANDEAMNEAGRLADILVNAYPKNVMFVSDRAYIRYVSEDFDGALADYLIAAKLNKKDPLVLYNIAYLYEGKGYKKQALKYYNAVLKLDDEYFRELAQYGIDELSK